MDTRQQLGLGSSGGAANSLRSILKEFTDSVNKAVSSISAAFNGANSSGGSTVFNQGKPSVSTNMNSNLNAGSGNGGGPSGGRGGQFMDDILPGGKYNAAIQTFRQSLPSTQAAVNQNIIGTRAGFYGYGNGNLNMRYDQQQMLAKNMMFNGMNNGNALDASNAMMLGQSSGIGMGLSNYRSLAMGVSTMSNLTPGLGMEGSMQAFVAMQQPRTINTMRMMGIMARDPATGKPVPPEQVAQQLWNKISREKRGSGSISKDDLATSLLPGNALDSLLNQVTGGDPILRQQIEAYFYARAAGAKNASKKELSRVGLISDYEAATSKRTAEEFRGISQTSRSAAAGAEMGTQFATAVEAFANAVDRLTGYQKLGTFGNSFGEVASTAMNGSLLMGLAQFLGIGRASGGEVGGQNAYVVGEKGPELFVPKNDGTIIPNHMLNFKGFRGGGGDTPASGEPLSNTDLRSVLEQAGFTGGSLDTAMSVVRQESGGRPGALNPNAKTGDYSMGLFQINMIGDLGKRRNANYLKKYGDIGYTGPESLYDPLINASIAYDISKGGTKWTDAWVNTSKKLGLTDSNSVSQGAAVSSSGQTLNSTTAGGYTFRDALSNRAASLKSSGGSSTVINGGVTITVDGTKDPQAVAKAVKKALEEAGIKGDAAKK